MDRLKPQIPCGSSYGTEPRSPGGQILDTMHYYSAPSSPIRRIGSDIYGYESETQNTNENIGYNSDFFEFATVQAIFNVPQLEKCQKREPSTKKQDELGDSIPTMAFADELFSNGQVKPLKLPPRLQHGGDMTRSQTLSPSSVLKNPFVRRNMWNDDYDPFMVALEKVKDEKRGRKSVHRRTRSHSPYRTTSVQWPISSGQDPGENKQEEKVGPSVNGLAEPKGSAYSRWARNESMGHKRSWSHAGASQRGSLNFKALSFRRKVRPAKMGQEGQEGPIKPTMKQGENAKEKGGDSNGDTNKIHKVKGMLLRYASFGKENGEGKLKHQISALWKPTYFKNLSYKFKGYGHGNGKKKVVGESKMVIVPYRPNKLILCLGYGSESPRV